MLREQLLAKGTDVDKVLLQVEQLSAQQQHARSKYDQILNALKFLMGVPVDQIIEVESEIVYHDTINIHINPLLIFGLQKHSKGFY